MTDDFNKVIFLAFEKKIATMDNVEYSQIIMISSELPEIVGLCDRVVVMAQGKVQGTLEKEELQSEKDYGPRGRWRKIIVMKKNKISALASNTAWCWVSFC